MKKFQVHLDETLSEALMREARKELRYPDQYIESLIRKELGIPVPPEEMAKEPVPSGGGPHD
jgi:hypothetical protein